VITDGLENASREFRRADIVRMMDERKQQGWQFAFLSADLDAIQEAHNLGFAAHATMPYARSAQGVRLAFASLADSVRDVREARRRFLTLQDEDRRRQEEERKKSEGT